jgi:hypothetical protein
LATLAWRMVRPWVLWLPILLRLKHSQRLLLHPHLLQMRPLLLNSVAVYLLLPLKLSLRKPIPAT